MAAPNIDSSTREERLDYVLNEWRCLHNCEMCGKCHVLKGRCEEMLYADSDGSGREGTIRRQRKVVVHSMKRLKTRSSVSAEVISSLSDKPKEQRVQSQTCLSYAES
ncbi:MAG: hypothetical protein SOZ58_10720 [Prevotella sp.]|nr:hypothetical protein [Prevotella sp.]